MQETPTIWMLILGLCCLAVPVLAGTVALVVVFANRRQRTGGRTTDTRRGRRAPASARQTAPAFCPECGTALAADARNEHKVACACRCVRSVERFGANLLR